MSTWIVLALAIVAEVIGTTALRASDGMTRVLPGVVVVVAYVISFVLLAVTLKHLALGTTYAIWSGVGTLAIALIGWLVYQERLSRRRSPGSGSWSPAWSSSTSVAERIADGSHYATMTRIMNPPVSELAAPAGRSRTIQSVDRAAALLKAIADASRPPTVVELAETCMLNRSTAWRLLATLDAHGLIERDPVSQRYSLGYAFLRIAAGADIDPLVRRARPVLEQLARDTAEATNLAVAKRFNLVYVDQVDPPQIMAPNWFGRPVPLHATSTGKAYLAFLSPDERRAALPERLDRYTETTITDRRRLGAELDDVRRDGWAVCVGELEESLFGASAPVLSEQGRPVAVVSVWGTEHRLPRERLPEIGRQTLAAAKEIKGLLR